MTISVTGVNETSFDSKSVAANSVLQSGSDPLKDSTGNAVSLEGTYVQEITVTENGQSVTAWRNGDDLWLDTDGDHKLDSSDICFHVNASGDDLGAGLEGTLPTDLDGMTLADVLKAKLSPVSVSSANANAINNLGSELINRNRVADAEATARAGGTPTDVTSTIAMNTTTKPEPVKMQVIIDLETSGDTPAEELGWLLNLLRYELGRAPGWRGRIRRVII